MVMGGHFQHCRFSILVPFSKFKSVLLLFYFIHNPEFGTKQNSRVSLEDQIKLHSNQQQKHSQNGCYIKMVVDKDNCTVAFSYVTHTYLVHFTLQVDGSTLM